MSLIKLKESKNRRLYTNEEGFEKIKLNLKIDPASDEIEYYIKTYEGPGNYSVKIHKIASNGIILNELLTLDLYIEIKDKEIINENKVDVVVLFSKKNGIAKFCYGKYIGEKIPTHEKDRNTMADFLRDIKKSNPCIETNTGLIWGCECWWGQKERMLKSLKECKLVEYTVEEYFSEVKNNEKM